MWRRMHFWKGSSIKILDIPGGTAYIDTKLKTVNECALLISAFVHPLLLRAAFIFRLFMNAERGVHRA